MSVSNDAWWCIVIKNKIGKGVRERNKNSGKNGSKTRSLFPFIKEYTTGISQAIII